MNLVLVGAAGLGAFVFLCLAVARWPVLGLSAIGLQILVAWEVPQTPVLAEVAGRQLYPEDVLCAVFVVIAAARWRRVGEKIRGPMLLVVPFIALLLWSLVRGVVEFGLAKPVNEAREVTYLVIASAWLFTLDWASGRATSMVRRWLFTVCSLLMVVLVYHVMVFGIGDVDSFVQVGSLQQTARPVVAMQAFVLCCGALWALASWLTDREPHLMVLGVVLMAGVVVGQHRSVWVAATAGLIVLLVRVSPRSLRNLVYPGIAVTWLLVIAGLAGVFDSVISNATTAVSDTGTYEWRISGLWALVGQSVTNGVSTVVFGGPYGAGWARYEDGLIVTFSPHNWYLDMYLRGGLIGLVALVGLLITMLVRLLRRIEFAPQAALLTAILVYAWPYSLGWYIAPVLSWALLAANGSIDESRRGEPDTEPRSVPEPRLARHGSSG